MALAFNMQFHMLSYTAYGWPINKYVLFGTYFYQKAICCLSEILVHVAILCFLVFHLLSIGLPLRTTEAEFSIPVGLASFTDSGI